MTFFESLIALLAVAVLLLQITRRLQLPYPGILAAGGVAVALTPGAPNIPIDPHTALALFIAPVIIDSAFDFPLKAAWRMWLPLLVYAVGAVLVTTGVVVAISAVSVGLPLAAAVTLGAIVAPPDAAAAAAVLRNLPVARRADALLKGESLLNDATALMLFSAALTIQTRGGLDGATTLQLSLAAPGGILFGIGYGYLVSKMRPFTGNSVGGTLLQFVNAFATWLIAERLHLSAVLATVATGMTIAANTKITDSPRMRVHSYAVWTTVVFLLNVLAFLLMGLQARRILGAMSQAELNNAFWFAGTVVAAVIAVRLAIAFCYRIYVVQHHRRRGGQQPLRPSETFLIGWTGMRGLLTLATAFALPASFPQRDLVVLTAFAVVLATLIVQGATLAPLIRWLGADRTAEAEAERDAARRELGTAALTRLQDETGPEAEAIRAGYHAYCAGMSEDGDDTPLARRRGLSLAAVLAQRKRLEELRDDDRIGADHYLELQEDLDWKQLAAMADDERRITEN